MVHEQDDEGDDADKTRAMTPNCCLPVWIQPQFQMKLYYQQLYHSIFKTVVDCALHMMYTL